jgi:hypothetical protein
MLTMESISHLTMIFISFSIGSLFGALWMFSSNYHSNKVLEEELDSKTRQLESFLNKYEDDDYEAY